MARLSTPNPNHRRNVRRSLFGPRTTDDKIKVDKWLNERLNAMNMENVEKSKIWGFDFLNDKPLSPSGVDSCDYQWIPCFHYEVPAFYRSKDGSTANDDVTGSSPSRADVISEEENVNNNKIVRIAVVASTSSLTTGQQQQEDLSKKFPKDFDVDMTTPLKPATTAEASSQTVAEATAAPPPVNPKPKKQHQTQLSDFYRTQHRGKRSARTSLTNKFLDDDQRSSASFSTGSSNGSPLSSCNDTTDDDDETGEACRSKMSRFDNESSTPSFATTADRHNE